MKKDKDNKTTVSADETQMVGFEDGSQTADIQPAEPTATVAHSIAGAVKMYITKYPAATLDDVIAWLKSKNAACAISTIKSNYSAVRKELGLSKKKAESTKEIEELFATGVHSAAEMVEAIKKQGLDIPEATIRTKVGKLRRDAGLVQSKKIDITLD